MARSETLRPHGEPQRLPKRSQVLRVAAVLFCGGFAAGAEEPVSRVWTNSLGKTITATYRGSRGAEVALELPGGKISFVPLSGLSLADVRFVKANRLDFHGKWQAWPENSRQTKPSFPIEEESRKAGDFVYTTGNFRFHCDVDLGPVLMRDLARTFELTFELHSKSPFGILADSEKDRFEARLFGTLNAYHSAGGPQRSAGVYLRKERVFLAPLELMGMQAGSAGYRRDPDSYDVSTIVHELTHMLTHEMLESLPVWMNEGYAEYIASIPRGSHGFKTAPDEIREGVQDLFVADHLRSARTSSGKKPDWSNSKRTRFLKSGVVPPLPRIAEVLVMADDEWVTGKAHGSEEPSGKPKFFGELGPDDRMPRLYRTAHLIFYYYIQIEGEKGATKIRRALEDSRKAMERHQAYLEEFAAYEKAMAAFLELPGVIKLSGGQFRYPSDLTPPQPPKNPAREGEPPNMQGLVHLLNGESAEAVGARIEAALATDLGIKFTFK